MAESHLDLSAMTLAEVQSEERKPNVIFILADDHGYGDLSSFRAEEIATPNNERMV